MCVSEQFIYVFEHFIVFPLIQLVCSFLGSHYRPQASNLITSLPTPSPGLQNYPYYFPLPPPGLKTSNITSITAPWALELAILLPMTASGLQNLQYYLPYRPPELQNWPYYFASLPPKLQNLQYYFHCCLPGFKTGEQILITTPRSSKMAMLHLYSPLPPPGCKTGHVATKRSAGPKPPQIFLAGSVLDPRDPK